MNSVFALTTLRLVEKVVTNVRDCLVINTNLVQFEGRTVALFRTREKAIETLKENFGGLDEAGYYPFAVIEEVELGLYPIADYDKSEFWEWQRGTQDEWKGGKWVKMPPAPEDKAYLNYVVTSPGTWGKWKGTEDELEKSSFYAHVG